ncbi:hypothetical protein PoHVEF18_007870 [Penicillium ochrochloron]
MKPLVIKLLEKMLWLTGQSYKALFKHRRVPEDPLEWASEAAISGGEPSLGLPVRIIVGDPVNRQPKMLRYLDERRRMSVSTRRPRYSFNRNLEAPAGRSSQPREHLYSSKEDRANPQGSSLLEKRIIQAVTHGDEAVFDNRSNLHVFRIKDPGHILHVRRARKVL